MQPNFLHTISMMMHLPKISKLIRKITNNKFDTDLKCKNCFTTFLINIINYNIEDKMPKKHTQYKIKTQPALPSCRSKSFSGGTLSNNRCSCVGLGTFDMFLPDPGVSGVRSMGPGVHTSKNFVKLC